MFDIFRRVREVERTLKSLDNFIKSQNEAILKLQEELYVVKEGQVIRRYMFDELHTKHIPLSSSSYKLKEVVEALLKSSNLLLSKVPAEPEQVKLVSKVVKNS